MRDSTRYACSGYLNGRVCGDGLAVRRDVLEERLLASVRRELLSERSVAAFKPELRRALRQRPEDPAAGRRAKLQRQVAALVDAIAAGMNSPAVAGRLRAVEQALAALPPPPRIVDVSEVLSQVPAAVERHRALVQSLGDAPVGPEEARALVSDLVGEIQIARGREGLLAKVGPEIQKLSRAYKSGSGGRI